MPQVSLYLDEETMSSAKKAAASQGKSLSKYVADIVKRDLSEESSAWPKRFWETFGAISDETFVRSSELSWDADAPRLAFE